MHERIKQIIDNEGLSVRKFEDKIHCSVGVIARALKNKTDISSRFLISIKEVFPQYSAEWLLTGKGEMLVSKEGEEGVSSAEECKQTDNVEEENISRRLDDMEKREAQRDFLLTRIADTLDGINKILAHLPENPEKESSVKNHSSLCG